MRYYEIAPLKIIRKNCDFLTYSNHDDLSPGLIVEIPVGKKTMLGVVWKKVDQPNFATKPIAKIVASSPIPEHILGLVKWISQYYQTPLAQVLSGVLPTGLNKNRRQKSAVQKSEMLKKSQRTNFLYNEQQMQAIDKLDKLTRGTCLLHGITGSGKTAIYIDQAKKAFARGESVIVLVPEIALTSQLVANFSENFGNIKIIHSRQTESERHLTWLEILQEKAPQIIIGARSALFAPVKKLGLIIIDEAHEPSFKQEQTPKYSALRASSFLANSHNLKTIFGSATPLIEDYFLASQAKKPSIITLDKLAKTDAKPPTIEVVDLTKKQNLAHKFLSKQLLATTRQTLAENKQVLLYHNRRGSASITMCYNCGWQALCPNCHLPLTLHADKHKLVCHICGNSQKVPLSCPDCNEPEIIHKGIGTKIIEQEIRKMFPDKKIARFDADNDKNQTVENRYQEIIEGEIDIIIGTQVIAKGLDLPKLKTVGVIQADAGLALPDFTSSERNFQLLAQVIGRVGRHSSDTNVVIQTFQPSAPSIQFGIKQDYEGFYQNEIAARKNTNFPPFAFLLKLTCVYKTEKTAISNAKKQAVTIREKFGEDVQIFGPTPAFYERIGETYRWQIIIKSKKRAILLEIARELQDLPHWRVDIDPPSLI